MNSPYPHFPTTPLHRLFPGECQACLMLARGKRTTLTTTMPGTGRRPVDLVLLRNRARYEQAAVAA